MLVCAAAAGLFAQDAAPRFDARLSVHTILREDIFAGFMANDTARLERGERNLAALERERPDSLAPLTAWKGTIALTRAAHAHEAHRDAEFAERYREAKALFAEADRLGPANFGVKAVTGGSFAALTDRLPESARAEASEIAYRSYAAMWKMQSPMLGDLELHNKGELLAGMAQSAARAGHAEEAREFAKRILETMPDTPYAKATQRWLERPETMTQAKIACQTCHEPGRLAARTAALGAGR
jgi:hypothetical protein